MNDIDLCTCSHIRECHGNSKVRHCMGPTGYAFGAFSYGCPCKEFELDMENPKNIQYWDLFYPEGWRKIVYKLNADIEAISPGHTIEQIKEKFGGLRYYCSVDDYSKVDDLIIEAEKESMKTCEVCGNFGKIRNNRSWIVTLCDIHDTETNPYYEYYLVTEEGFELGDTVGVSKERWKRHHTRYAAAIQACEDFENFRSEV